MVFLKSSYMPVYNILLRQHKYVSLHVTAIGPQRLIPDES